MFVPPTKLPFNVDQANTKLGPVEAVPFKTIEFVAQSIVSAAPAFEIGTFKSCVTITVSLSEQPFVGFVTVKIYIPAASTIGEKVVCPLTKCPFGVVQFAVKLAPPVKLPASVAVGVAQPMVMSGPALATGRAAAEVTTTEVVSMQVNKPFL